MLEVKVSGMSCNHCVKAITEALQELHEGAEIQVDLSSGTVRVGSPLDSEAVSAAIEDAGFEVTAISALS